MTHPIPPSAFPRRRSSWFTGLCAGLALGAAVAAQAADLSGVRSVFVDQSPRPDPLSVAAFDLNVLHPEAQVDMEPGHALGSRYLALLDASQVRTGTESAMKAMRRSLPSRPVAGEEGVRLVEVENDAWLPWAVEALADPAAKRGFDGFVLTLGTGTAAPTPAARQALFTLAASVHQRYPDKCLLLDLRSGVGAEALHIADGFLALGVYTRPGKAAGEIDWTPLAETQQLTRAIRTLSMQGLPTYAVDYAPVGDRPAAREAVKRLTATGALPFITTPALSGVNLGPLEETARRVVVLHGWDARHTGQPAPEAATTSTARHLRQVLEWLGCQVEFRLATGTGAEFLPEAEGLAGVILDAGLVLSAEQQQALAAWLPALRAQEVPLLLTGMPFTEDGARATALRHLGLGGSGAPVGRLAKATVAGMDSTLLRQGARIQGRTLGFLDLAAPAGARTVLGLRGQDALGGDHRFDQIFLAPWGAAWLEPAVEATGPQVQVPAFLTAWLGGAGHTVLPVPDTTTREGRRVFYSHVESTGFATPSTLPGLPLCSEVLRDRILDRYLLPVTVSVCEAEVRAWLPEQDPEDAARLEHTARTLYSLPQVQAASNSFTRPAQWAAGVDIAAPLNERATSARRDMEREIGGSLSYIHRQLLPQGKVVQLMLWPSGATPTPQAVGYCRAMGVEQLPGSLPAAPASLQPALPATSTDALVREGPGPRLEPLALRCSFADARTEEGVKALEKLFDACSGEPLHAISAATYAASLQDARHTRVLRVAPAHWLILNQGACRTLRLPASAGLPDMARCLGVSGYQVRGDQLYIHTMGNARTELVLTHARPAPYVHVVESSTTVHFLELTSSRATFEVRDLRPVELVLGGFQPRGVCAYLENGRPYTARADANGRVHLELVCRATVSVQSLPPATEAVMR